MPLCSSSHYINDFASESKMQTKEYKLNWRKALLWGHLQTIYSTEWLLPPNDYCHQISGMKSHKLTVDTDCIYQQLSDITDLLLIFHLQDTITRNLNQLEIARSCNLCIPDCVINN